MQRMQQTGLGELAAVSVNIIEDDFGEPKHGQRHTFDDGITKLSISLAEGIALKLQII